MPMIVLEAIGPRGEQLSREAGNAMAIAVGWDSDLGCATFDSDGHADEDELQDAVFAALAELDTDWEEHLRVAE